MNDGKRFGCIFAAMLIANGGYIAMWPEDVVLRQKETEDKALVTADERRRTRMIGLALIACGGVVLWATRTGLLSGGAVDPVLI